MNDIAAHAAIPDGTAIPGDEPIANRATVAYTPSWLHRLVDLIERLPGPTWAAYVVIAVVSIVVVHTQVWSTGVLPIGSLDPVNVYYGVLPVALIWAAGYLETVAAGAFDSFRPSLTLGQDEVDRLRHELTVMPSRPSLILTIAAMVITVLSYVADPVSSGIIGVPAPALLGRYVLESFNTAVILLLIYQLLRQMRDVRRTLARSTVVDLFQPSPLYAFSKLTSRAGIVIVAVVASSVLFVPLPAMTDTLLVTWVPFLVIPPLIAAIAFLLPLYGMHGRLVAEKDGLQAAAEDRLKGLLSEINQDVDARDLRRADGLNKALASMLQQRDVLAKLPTWPWSAGTLRAFVTAIFLPIALFLIQRLLSQFV
jgi:hypothetical protein